MRANGGKYYDDFINNEYIGIKYNLLAISALKSLEKDSMVSQQRVKDMMFDKYKELKKANSSKYLNHKSKTQLTLHAKQTYDFTFKMKIGDVILTPAKRSYKFALGVIISDPFDARKDSLLELEQEFEKGNITYIPSGYSKRRKVLWLHTIERKDIPKELIWIINAHQALTELDLKDKSKLFNLIVPCYYYNEKYYLRLYTSKGNDFSLENWSTLISTIKSNSIERVDLRADINSPGWFTFLIKSASDVQKIASALGISHQEFWNIIGGLFLGKELINLIVGKNNVKKGLTNWILEMPENFWKHRTKAINARNEYLEAKNKNKKLKRTLGVEIKPPTPIDEKNNSKLVDLFSNDKEDPTKSHKKLK